MPSSSGGAITDYLIAPDLPTGLSLDPRSGMISGTPLVAADPQAYTVTASNSAGSAQAVLKIEIRKPLAAPANLSYADSKLTYLANQPIAPNVPSSTGGPIESYGVSPALPEGLKLDPLNGVISGTPTVVSNAGTYTVTGLNTAGSVQVALTIEVDDQAPSALTYDDVSPVYAQYGEMTRNAPRNLGGHITSFSVSPTLPTGMSLDPVTGVIGGRPSVEVHAPYVVTANNRTGSTRVTLQITVQFPPTPLFSVGDAVRIPVRGSDTWNINDSVFPWLPNLDHSGYLAFWGDAGIRRYVGPDFDNLKPLSSNSNGVVTVTNAPGVDHGWDADGRWMLTATRIADGTLVAFVHGENHEFADGKPGEWNSTGLLTSQDDGLTWVDQGAVVAEQKSTKGQNGGINASEVIWDSVNQRWLGYSGGIPFISTDPYAMPGTWYGYYKGAFSQYIDVHGPKPALSVAPGLEKAGVTWGGLTYNHYLKQYILTWLPNGEYKKIHAAFSPDGLHWGPAQELYKEVPPYSASYAFIVGDTDTLSGQDCSLIYMREPHVSGNKKDMIRRPIHFQ